MLLQREGGMHACRSTCSSFPREHSGTTDHLLWTQVVCCLKRPHLTVAENTQRHILQKNTPLLKGMDLLFMSFLTPVFFYSVEINSVVQTDMERNNIKVSERMVTSLKWCLTGFSINGIRSYTELQSLLVHRCSNTDSKQALDPQHKDIINNHSGRMSSCSRLQLSGVKDSLTLELIYKSERKAPDHSRWGSYPEGCSSLHLGRADRHAGWSGWLWDGLWWGHIW